MWEWVIILFLGLSCGSFITLASYRLPRDEDIIFTPSRCTACNRSLKPRDLVPVFSWLANCMECRFCHKPVHWRYPMIEIITAGAFALIYARHGVSWEAGLLALLAIGLLIMIVADFEHYIIPDEVHYLLAPTGIAYRLFTGTHWFDVAAGFLLGLAIGLALRFGYQWLRKREGLGWGDVKFFAIVGLWLGVVPLVPFLFFAGLFGVLTALMWRSMGKGALFPFGPALALALFACVLYPEMPQAFWNLQRALYL
jgi:leader peptidase (prepilin peptidase) / N-methyltransferase